MISTDSILEVGSNVKDLSIKLTNVNNEEEVLLSDLTNNHLSLFILLRHFAWLPWRLHLKQIESNLDKFVSLNCHIHVVSFGSPEGARLWREETRCAFPLWTNSNRQLYSSLGFKRSIFQVFLSYLKECSKDAEYLIILLPCCRYGRLSQWYFMESRWVKSLRYPNL